MSEAEKIFHLQVACSLLGVIVLVSWAWLVMAIRAHRTEKRNVAILRRHISNPVIVIRKPIPFSVLGATSHVEDPANGVRLFPVGVDKVLSLLARAVKEAEEELDDNHGVTPDNDGDYDGWWHLAKDVCHGVSPWSGEGINKGSNGYGPVALDLSLLESAIQKILTEQPDLTYDDLEIGCAYYVCGGSRRHVTIKTARCTLPNISDPLGDICRQPGCNTCSKFQ